MVWTCSTYKGDHEFQLQHFSQKTRRRLRPEPSPSWENNNSMDLEEERGFKGVDWI
jgi:hypothetical protein